MTTDIVAIDSPRIASALVTGWLAGLTEEQRDIISTWDRRALEDLARAALDGDLAFVEQIIEAEDQSPPPLHIDEYDEAWDMGPEREE